MLPPGRATRASHARTDPGANADAAGGALADHTVNEATNARAAGRRLSRANSNAVPVAPDEQAAATSPAMTAQAQPAAPLSSELADTPAAGLALTAAEATRAWAEANRLDKDCQWFGGRGRLPTS